MLADSETKSKRLITEGRQIVVGLWPMGELFVSLTILAQEHSDGKTGLYLGIIQQHGGMLTAHN